MTFLIPFLFILGYILSVISFFIVKAQQLVFRRWKIPGLITSVVLEIFCSITVYHWSYSFFTAPDPTRLESNLSGLEGAFDWLFATILIVALLILNVSNIVSAIAMINEYLANKEQTKPQD